MTDEGTNRASGLGPAPRPPSAHGVFATGQPSGGLKQSARLTVGLSAVQVGGLVLVVGIGFA